MVNFKVLEKDFFYILRTDNSKEIYVYDKLDASLKDIKIFIKDNKISSEEIELMSIQFKGNKINAQQVSWATIAEKLIKGE